MYKTSKPLKRGSLPLKRGIKKKKIISSDSELTLLNEQAEKLLNQITFVFLTNGNTPLSSNAIRKRAGATIENNVKRKFISQDKNTIIRQIKSKEQGGGYLYRLNNKYYLERKKAPNFHEVYGRFSTLKNKTVKDVKNNNVKENSLSINKKALNVNFWWVNQNQTYKYEINNGYMWSPKTKKDGSKNVYYDNMVEVSKGDIVYSFIDSKIKYVGLIESLGYSAKKPNFGKSGSVNWKDSGWKVDVKYFKVAKEIKPKDYIEEIRPLLPEKYSPLQKNGNGNQNLYLTKIKDNLALKINELIEFDYQNISDKKKLTKSKVSKKIKPTKENLNKLELKPFYPNKKDDAKGQNLLINPDDLYKKSLGSIEKTKTASKIHEETLEILSKYLSQLGYEMLWNGRIDGYAELKETNAIFEVKSIENHNEKSQIRGAIAQLPEYRFFHNIENASLWLVLSSKPSDVWIYYIRNDRKINLLWIDDGKLAGPDIDKIK
ncbi:MAG: hypothetical protein CMG09_03445 [Candidatus Marinimicrobia bacterium]|nr:hypothetical protein [Candidatus Neomarinimicrobiota bacterium]